MPDLVFRKCRDQPGPKTKDVAKSAGDVVLAAALEDAEAAGRTDPALARVETQHHLAERKDVEGAVTWLAQRQNPAGRRGMRFGHVKPMRS